MRVRLRNTSRAALVHDQVHVALAVARLGVGEAVPLVRQRPQRLGQQPQLSARTDSSPVCVRISVPVGADDVADVPALELLVGGAERVGLQEAGCGRSSPAAARTWPCPSRAWPSCVRRRAPAPGSLDSHSSCAIAVGRLQVAGQRVAAEVVRERAPRSARRRASLARRSAISSFSSAAAPAFSFVGHGGKLTGPASGWPR